MFYQEYKRKTAYHSLSVYLNNFCVIMCVGRDMLNLQEGFIQATVIRF